MSEWVDGWVEGGRSRVSVQLAAISTCRVPSEHDPQKAAIGISHDESCRVQLSVPVYMQQLHRGGELQLGSAAHCSLGHAICRVLMTRSAVVLFQCMFGSFQVPGKQSHSWPIQPGKRAPCTAFQEL